MSSTLFSARHEKKAATAGRPAAAPQAATGEPGPGLPPFLQSVASRGDRGIGRAGDEFEREADQAASNTAAPGAKTPRSNTGETPQRMSPADIGEPGEPMTDDVRREVEPRTGVDLGSARVHASPRSRLAAAAIGARAFTHGDHIFLREEHDARDLPLMAHEATHVRQQREDDSAPAVQRQELPPEREDPATAPSTESGPRPALPQRPATAPGEAASEIREESTEPEGGVQDAAEGEATEADGTDAAPGDAEAGESTAEEAGTEEEPEAEAGDEAEDLATGEQPGSVPGGARGQGGEEAAEGEGAPGGRDAVIEEELAEHERWAGSFGEMGTAGSDERARFLLNQAGQGGVSGLQGGATMGFAMGAIGAAVGQVAGRRLATLAVSRGASATPIPGLGSAIGGVMAVAGLAMRDWSATGETIGRIGEGEGYERLANDLEGLAEVLDVASSIMDVLAGVLGGIALGMWVGAVLSAGTLSPLAASLSAVALAINAATTAVGIIISVVIRPTVTALRALHAFQSQGDPAQIEADGQMLQGAAAQVTGAAAGAVAGRLGGAAGGRGGTRADRLASRLQARRTGGRPAMSAQAGPGPRVHVEVPEAPSRAADATTAPRPAADGTPPATTARPASTEGPSAATPSAGTAQRPPEDFSDLADVVADLNASPEVAARLTDTRAPLPRRATPWGPGEARAYANRQAEQHRTATGMTGGEVQAGHTAAARHAAESGIREQDWDTQPWMDLHSRRGQGLDVTVTDPVTGRRGTRTRHTAQERLIDAAVGRSREAQGQLTPQGQLDAAAQVAWATENTPWRQQDIDFVRGGGLAAPERGAAVDPATGRVIPPQGPDAASPTARSGAAPRSPHASHTETVRTTDRAAAMAQYHEQIRMDPGRESGVWRGADGTYYVMQGDSGSVRRPAAAGPLELVYHSHPTEADAASQGLVSQPSQAAGDIGVLQHQHGTGPAGRRQESELHFPVYDAAGNHTGYGATRFAYDPTNPLPLQVQTTMPGGGTSTQRYASFADFQARTGIHAGGATAADSAAARAAADVRLGQDVAAAQQRVDVVTQQATQGTRGLMGVREGIREGRDEARQTAAEEQPGTQTLAGPAYTAAIPGLAPGESLDIPINPAYPSPPGTPAELDALMDQVAVSQEAQRELGATERTMQTQASEQETHGTQLGEAQTVAEDLATGRTDHQGIVDTTEQTNTDQQSTSEDALGNLGRSAEEATALTTLVGSLRVFQGLAHLFTYLPGDLGRKAEGAKQDAEGLIEALNRVTETESVEAGVETGQQVIEADAGRITAVSTQGESTDEELTAGQEQITTLTDANAEALSETQAVESQAAAERQAAASSEEEAQSAHDDLLAQLQQWAQEHRQAREDAIAQAVSSYQDLGYLVEPQP